MRYSTILAVSVALGLSANAQAPAGQNQPVQEQNGQKNDPGTVGAMQDQAGNQAMSPEDVRRQTQGKPPMQQQALKGKPQQQQPTRILPVIRLERWARLQAQILRWERRINRIGRLPPGSFPKRAQIRPRAFFLQKRL